MGFGLIHWADGGPDRPESSFVTRSGYSGRQTLPKNASPSGLAVKGKMEPG
jgi:hypothetical protein